MKKLTRLYAEIFSTLLGDLILMSQRTNSKLTFVRKIILAWVTNFLLPTTVGAVSLIASWATNFPQTYLTLEKSKSEVHLWTIRQTIYFVQSIDVLMKLFKNGAQSRSQIDKLEHFTNHDISTYCVVLYKLYRNRTFVLLRNLKY